MKRTSRTDFYAAMTALRAAPCVDTPTTARDHARQWLETHA